MFPCSHQEPTPIVSPTVHAVTYLDSVATSKLLHRCESNVRTREFRGAIFDGRDIQNSTIVERSLQDCPYIGWTGRTFKGTCDPFRHTTNNGYRIPGSKEIRLESLSITESCGVRLVCTPSPVLFHLKSNTNAWGWTATLPLLSLARAPGSGKHAKKGNRRKQTDRRRAEVNRAATTS